MATDTCKNPYILGELIPTEQLTDMEWVEFEESIDRLNTQFFLGRFAWGAEGGRERVAYCTMDEDANVYALSDDSEENKPPNPTWLGVPDPDQVLVPIDRTAPRFDLASHLYRQKDFSQKTFGPGARTKGVIDHIRKELAEIEANPADIEEWVDVIILAFDGACRAGWNPDDIIQAIVAKQTKNEARRWPDWRTADPEKAIEHDRTGEQETAS